MKTFDSRELSSTIFWELPLLGLEVIWVCEFDIPRGPKLIPNRILVNDLWTKRLGLSKKKKQLACGFKSTCEIEEADMTANKRLKPIKLLLYCSWTTYRFCYFFLANPLTFLVKALFFKKYRHCIFAVITVSRTTWSHVSGIEKQQTVACSQWQ